MKKITITTDYVTLGQFLKLASIIQSGGEAKSYLLDAHCLINGEEDNRRGRKLRDGDKIEIEGNIYIIEHVS